MIFLDKKKHNTLCMLIINLTVVADVPSWRLFLAVAEQQSATSYSKDLQPVGQYKKSYSVIWQNAIQLSSSATIWKRRCQWETHGCLPSKQISAAEGACCRITRAAFAALLGSRLTTGKRRTTSQASTTTVNATTGANCWQAGSALTRWWINIRLLVPIPIARGIRWNL